MDGTNNCVALELLAPQKRGKELHPSKSMIVLKNEDNISSFLIQTFSKGGGGNPLTQIREVNKKALTHMQENSLAQASVYAATLGQFLMAPVKSVDVDDGRALGSTFLETEKYHCKMYQISFVTGMSKKRKVHQQNKSSSIGHFEKSN
jgi:hypothetical protein